MKKYGRIFKRTYEHWMKNEAFQQSAVIAYYTLFSLPSLLVLIIAVAGYFFDKSTVQGQIIEKMEEIIGTKGAEYLEKLITNVNVDDGSTIGLAVSIGVLVFGATGAFFQLKKAMNRIWSVREKKSGLLIMLLDRGISLALIIVIGILIVTSMVLTTAITFLGDYISDYAPAITSTALNGFNFLFSYFILTFLFAAVFKLLPDVRVRWRSTFVGATLTTILFLMAEYGLNIYFAKSDPTSVFGGASSVILIMLWIYYFCLILFFGAEFTVQYALFRGEEIKPDRFGEPAFIKEIEDLQLEEIHKEERKRILREILSREEAKTD